MNKQLTFNEIEIILSNKLYTKEYDNAVKEYKASKRNKKADKIIDNAFENIIHFFMNKNNINYLFGKWNSLYAERFDYQLIIIESKKYSNKDFSIGIVIDDKLDKFTLCIKNYYKTCYSIRDLLLSILIIYRFWKKIFNVGA